MIFRDKKVKTKNTRKVMNTRMETEIGEVNSNYAPVPE